MTASPLASPILFQIGPVPIAEPVLVTWGLILVLALLCPILTRRLALVPSRRQAALELVVAGIDQQISETMRSDPAPYRVFLGTLFLFILAANWTSMLPGIEPPTAFLETDAALALLVFAAVIWFGIRARGPLGYLASFAAPSLLMLPLNLIESVARTFSLLVRLFGNVMSGVFLIGIVLSLAGFLVPIPLMALELLTGAIQAYIFSVLAMVFISGAIGETAASRSKQRTTP